jgi:20S proteasome alpha/beta subunit
MKSAAKKGANTGTVILAFPYNHGILIGADRQVSWGSRKIWRTNFNKIEQINGFSAIAMCGTVTMCQWILDVYKNILTQLETHVEGTVSLKSQTMVLWRLMRAWAWIMELDCGAAFIFAGLDPRRKEGSILEFGGDGSRFFPEGHYLTNGSGYLEADGVLKDHFASQTPKDTDEKAAIALALKAIRRAAEKDLGVGDPRLQSATIALIDTETGFKYLPEEKIQLAVEKQDTRKTSKGRRK